MSNAILSVNDLAISFCTYGGTVRAVRGITFDLKRGETIAIVGESGSGKSVSIKCIMGILAKNAIVESGEIVYDGRNLLQLSEQQYRDIRGAKIGLIFQDPLSALNPIMKIGHQICEAIQINKSIPPKAAQSRAIELMRAVGITDAERRFHQYPFQFSGGMRQRIVIAIALARDPEILICDEPTTALDVTVQAIILDLINQIKRERNLSVIFITHDLGVVANIADRVNVMYAGKIVETGTVDDIFFDPRHPYTQALLASLPTLDTTEQLVSIPGVPPNMLFPPKGDAFAARNPKALRIDFVHPPPFFKISDTHYAATWNLHPFAPKVELPVGLKARIERMREEMHD